MVVGGRIADVGVGGLITGGGISHLTTAYGFAADNVATFQVVLADGRIVEASAQNHVDLFKALKGGSGNFGIVTRFNLYTIPTPRGVWGGVQVFTPDKYDSLVNAYTRYQMENQVADPKATVLCVQIFSATRKIWMNVLAHPEQDDPATLQEWDAIGPVFSNTQHHAGLADLISSVDSMGKEPIQRQDFRTLSIGVSAELLAEVVALFTSTYDTIKETNGLQAVLAYQSIALSAIEAAKKRGGNPLGYEEKAQTWLCLNTAWADTTDDDTVILTNERFLGKVKEIAKAKGLWYEFIYLNDAGQNQQVIQSYGTANVQFLKDVSVAYDPQAVFQNLSKGGFKIGR